MHIRPIRVDDEALLLALWERSVRATHAFVSEADIEAFRPLVAGMLADRAIDLWVLAAGDEVVDVPLGFMGLEADSVAALFLDPDHRGRGGGRRLVAHAQQLHGGSLRVDVNEQNTDARAFYEAIGFVVVGRSPLDETGRPYPLLHLRRAAPAGAE